MSARFGEPLEDEPLISPRLAPLHPHLFVVLECDRPTAGGARHSLRGIDEVIIHRGTERGVSREFSGGVRRLVLELPGRCLSNEHARLVRQGPHWLVEDQASKNGTFLNGARVERATIGDGDVIDVGHTLLMLRLGLPTPLDAPLDSTATPGPASLPPTLLPLFARELGELSKISVSRLPVVLIGETGTGKEVFARAIHSASRRPGRFVAVNCGALPSTLVEGQLFGHVRGAFSGAVRDETGFVRAADGGTLLLDEMGDLPRSAQATLLRVLQEGEVVPVGSTRAIRVDVRVIVATQDPLEALVDAGRFRCDLRARLEGFVSQLPTLRDRREDLGILVAALWKKLRSNDETVPEIQPEAGRAMCAYDWPLNIRELEQCMARALALSGGGAIEWRHLPQHVASPVNRATRTSHFNLWKDDAALRRELVAKLEKYGGNVTHVARAMGRARMQVHRWMDRLAVDPEQFRKAR